MIRTREPEQIGKYKVIKKISEGTSGVVYHVEFEENRFALKLLKTSDKDTVDRFRKETSTLARISHENLVKISDIGDFDNRLFLVMEYLDGNTLDEELKKVGQLSEEVAIKVCVCSAKALSELHKNNLVHRDIKPANIFLVSDGSVRLIDLGLVGDVEQIKSETALVGTPLFISPEQSRVLKVDVDFRSDLYSLGSTFFCLLAGRTPFVGDLTEILQQHSAKVAPDVRDFNSLIRPSVATILAKLLKKDPDDRYQSTKGLLHDFERLATIDRLIQEGKDPKLGRNDRSTSTSRVAFVQRSEEIDRIRDVWRMVSGGNPRVLVVSGPSGSGKTRLCEEFFTEIKSSETLLLRTKCQLYDREIAFSPLREAIRSLLEEVKSFSDTERDAVFKSLREAGKGMEATLVGLFKPLSQVFPDAQQASHEIHDVEVDADAIYENLADFFARTLGSWRSTVVFMDDLQWLDQASLFVIEKILAKCSHKRVLLIGSTRDDQDSLQHFATVEERLQDFLAQQIRLTSFSSSQMGRLIADYLGAASVGAEIVEPVFKVSTGNPLIAIEYLRAGIDQGFIYFKSNVWHLNREVLEKISLSQNVFELILKRIESSSKKTKEFLQLAALYANTFDPDEIAKASEVDASALEETLLDCQSLALIEPVGLERFKFVHDKIPESLLGSIEAAELEKKCSVLAQFFHQKKDKSIEESFIVARLFAKSANASSPDSLRAHADAGAIAMSNFAFREAYSYLKFVYLPLCKDSSDPCLLMEITPKLAICASMAEDEELALECANSFIANADSDAEIAHALSLKVSILTTQSSHVEAWETFKEACHFLGKPFPAFMHWKIVNILWAWSLTLLAEFLPIRVPPNLYFGRKNIDLGKIFQMFRDAQHCAEAKGSVLDIVYTSFLALLLGQLVGGVRERATGYASACLVYGIFGLRGMSKAYAEKAKRCCALLKDPATAAYCESRRLTAFFYCGLINDFYNEYMAQKEQLHKYLSPTESSRFMTLLAYICHFRGLHQQSLEIWSQTVEAVENKSMRIPKHLVAIHMSHLWGQLAILGRAQESQRVQALALKINNELRYNQAASGSTMNAEIGIRQISGDLDTTTEEIVTAWWNRTDRGISMPYVNNMAAMVSFIRLYQLEKAKSSEHMFSKRHEFKKMLRHLSLRLYCPLFRSNFFFLKGSYNRAVGKYWLAKFYLGLAEKLASQSGGFRLLFDVQRERARIHFAENDVELGRLALAAAMTLASRFEWKLSRDQLVEEFGEHLQTSIVSSSNVGESTSHGSGTIVRGSKPGRRSGRGTGRTILGSTVVGTVQGGAATVVGMTGVDGIRFVNALLNVSAAFTTSVDPNEQSKAVLNELIKLFAAERGVIFSRNENSTDLQVVAGMNSDGKFLEDVHGFSTTIVNKVFETLKPVVIAGTEQAQAMGSESAVLYNLRSIMATPLLHKEKLLGVVYLDSSLTKGLFSKADVDLFSTLASQISVAFELSHIAQVELDKSRLQSELDIQSAIAEESKKVKIMVDNMQQAMFSVTSNGTIVEPVSRFSEKVFETPIAGSNLFEVLYKEEYGKEGHSAAQSVMSTVFGEDSLQWDLMESNLPKKVSFAAQASSQENRPSRTLKIQPSPIWNEQEHLDKILFVVEDVTQFEALEREVAQQKAQALMLGEIINSDRVKLRDFLRTCGVVIDKCLSGLKRLDSELSREIFRDIHTLKGNARVYKVKYLAEEIHSCESNIISHLSKPERSESDVGLAAEQLEKIKSIAALYLSSLEQLFSKSGDAAGSGPVNPVLVGQLRSVVEEVSPKLHAGEALKLRSALARLSYTSLKSVVEQFRTMVDEVSADLQKKTGFEVEGDAFVSGEQAHAIQESLLHLIRNSLDHGLEASEERKSAQKDEMGRIRVKLSDDSGAITIAVSDDGRGMSGEKIGRSALKKNLIDEKELGAMSEDEKVRLIFMPNFSTRDQASEISGRGIGMDVVKSSIEKLGGQVNLKTELGKGSTFVITIQPRVHDLPQRESA